MSGGVTNTKSYHGEVTCNVFVICLVAACGGLIFGYEIGISGVLTSMTPFLRKFFPTLYDKESEIVISRSSNQYCKYSTTTFTMFTSSLYLTAFVVLWPATIITRFCGGKLSMFIGGFASFVGALLSALANNMWVLIVGRIFLGIGIGFANQSVPLYLTEMAPYKYRGSLNMMFQLSITIGILVANVLNYIFAHIKGEWGWRLTFGGTIVPSMILIIGYFVLPDTPISLIERGKLKEGKEVLLKIRGVNNVDEEFNDFCELSNPLKILESNLCSRIYRSQLAFAILIPFFQQLTGMNVFMLYAPTLFKTFGFGDHISLLLSLINVIINSLATFVSIISVDKVGRRLLFLEGGVQMFICQLVIIITMALGFGNSGKLEMWYSALVVETIWIYIAGFAWSWGPLGWLVPSEIFPLEIRSQAQGVSVSVNMILMFFISQFFIPLLCVLRFGVFIFFMFWVFVMTIFIYKLFPETKGIPTQQMAEIWKQQPFWKKFVQAGNEDTCDLCEKVCACLSWCGWFWSDGNSDCYDDTYGPWT